MRYTYIHTYINREGRACMKQEIVCLVLLKWPLYKCLMFNCELRVKISKFIQFYDDFYWVARRRRWFCMALDFFLIFNLLHLNKVSSIEALCSICSIMLFTKTKWLPYLSWQARADEMLSKWYFKNFLGYWYGKLKEIFV